MKRRKRYAVYVDRFGGRYVVIKFDCKTAVASMLRTFGSKWAADSFAALIRHITW